MGFHEVFSILLARPPQRKARELHELATYFHDQAFFAGVDLAVLQEICGALTFHQAAPGQVVLHAGELTDRMYLLLSGSCSVVRHSRREGFQPPPPQQLAPGQALCEASLLVPGRRSDVAVTAGAAAATGGSGGGPAFAVLTRAAWSSLCTRAPLQPVCAKARAALLCCCARSLAAASSPGRRTLEQADDLAAVLKQLPSMSLTPDPVLRAMSVSASMHRLPPGTIIFEECTRAESEFVVLGGTVQVRRRRRRLGAPGARTTSASPRRKARPVAPAAAAVVSEVKSVREKIEEERKAREALKESLALSRDGLREPLAPPQPAAPQQPLTKSVDGSRRWMSEFVARARKFNPGAGGRGNSPSAPATAAEAAGGGSSPFVPVVSANGNLSRAARAWRRAVVGVGLPRSQRGTADGAEAAAGGAVSARRGAADAAGTGAAVDAAADGLLVEYERLKQEEAGLVTDVGNLLGGAGSREAYLRGIQEARSRRGYGYDYMDEQRQQDEQQQEDEAGAHGASAGWRSDEDRDGGDEDAVQPEDDVPAEDPLVRLRYLDRSFQLASKVVRFDEAAASLARLVAERGWDARSGSTNPAAAAAAEPSIQSLPTADVAPEDPGSDAPGRGADALASSGGAAAAAKAARRGGRALGTASGGDDDVAEPWDEQFTRLYGPDIGAVDAGHLAGELPQAALCRAAGLTGGAAASGPAAAAPLLRRADTAIAGPGGADVLVVALDALRRGHEAARDDLVAGRLAVLTALEPLRGLSDEHQAALALACGTVSLDAHQLIVRQGQLVDALYVVLEGEVRLLDDPMEGVAAAAAPAGSGSSGSTAAIAASFRASGRSMSLNSGTFNRRSSGFTAAVDSAAGARALAAPAPPAGGSGSGSGGHGAIRVRRAMASLAALSLLGPGGSFGESVLGYPEDVLAAVAAQAVVQVDEARKDAGGAESSSDSSSSSSDDDDGSDAEGVFALGASAHVGNRSVLHGGGSVSSRASGSNRSFTGGHTPAVANQFLASAVTSRPSRLLVLPRSLLVKYGYLRSSLPPFAEQRREAINGRRQQLKAGLQGLSGVSLGLVAVSPAAAAAGPGPTPGSPAPPAPGDRGGLVRSPIMPHPRPPSVRPVEFLEQMGFKGLSNPRTAAILGSLNTAGSAGGSGGSTPDQSSESKSVTALAMVERFRRLGTGLGGGAGGGSPDATGSRPGSGSQPTSALWQFLESNEDSPPEDGAPPLPAAPAAVRASVPLIDRAGLGGADPGVVGSVAASPSAAGPDLLAALPMAMAMAGYGTGGGGGGGGGDALRAPPKPCLMRTSLTGFRLYGNGTAATRQPNGMRVSSSGLPLVPSGAASIATTPKNSGRDGGGSPFLSRRATFQGPSHIRTDFFANDDGPPMDAESPQLRGLHANPVLTAPLLSPSATAVVTAVAVADAMSPNSSGGAAAATAGGLRLGARASTTTHLPTLGNGGGGGNRPDSPLALLASRADGGIGSGGGATAASPRRGNLLQHGGSSSFHMRASYAGGGGAAAAANAFGSWEHKRESSPGSPTPPQCPQPPQSSPHNHESSQGVNGWPASLGASASPRSRLHGGAGPRTVSQLEFALAAAQDGAGGTAAAAAAAAPPRALGGVGSLSGRHYSEFPEMRSSWDGLDHRISGGGAVGGGGGTVISRGGTYVATALALATLAANQPAPAAGQFLLMP